jgi:thiol:disulfide interchange protein
MLKIKRKAINYTMLIFALASLLSISFAQNTPDNGMKKESKEIDFVNGKWNEIAAKAKKSNKYIFVDAHTTWCSPCKLLKSKTFKEKEAAMYFNKNFINVTVDMEYGEGIALAEKWKVTVYPTLLFFTPQGKLVMTQVGFVNGKQLIEFGEQALKEK